LAGFNRSEDIDAASTQAPDEGTRRGVFVEGKGEAALDAGRNCPRLALKARNVSILVSEFRLDFRLG